MNQESKSLDVLGIKPIGDAINKVTEGTVDGASAFLSRICLPAAEEFGLLLRDQVSGWRANNAVAIARRAEEKVHKYGYENLKAHPRLVFKALEHGSWHDEDIFRDSWAGLLSSSCSESGTDDSNTVFITLLSSLTASQVRLLNYSCEVSNKFVSGGGWPHSDELVLGIDKLTEIMRISDIHRIDRELDQLRSLELICSSTGGGGFSPDSCEAYVAPSGLAMHLYVRCQGYIGSPIEYFDLTKKPEPKQTEQGACTQPSVAKAPSGE